MQNKKKKTNVSASEVVVQPRVEQVKPVPQVARDYWPRYTVRPRQVPIITLETVLRLPWMVQRYKNRPQYAQAEQESLWYNWSQFVLRECDEYRLWSAWQLLSRGFLTENGKHSFGTGFFRWERHSSPVSGTWNDFVSGEDVYYGPENFLDGKYMSPYATQGSEDLPLSYIGKEADIFGLRPKIDGTRFDLCRSDVGSWLSGPFRIPVPSDFPIEAAEYKDGVFHILYPYSSLDFEWEGWRFVSHPWKQEVPHVQEGLMVLTATKEYRIKRSPTLEILVKDGMSVAEPSERVLGVFGSGIFEVFYNWDVGKFESLQERPYKTPHPKPFSIMMLPSLNLFGNMVAKGRLLYGSSPQHYDADRNELHLTDLTRGLVGHSRKDQFLNPYAPLLPSLFHWVDKGVWSTSELYSKWEYRGTFVVLPNPPVLAVAYQRFFRWYDLNVGLRDWSEAQFFHSVSDEEQKIVGSKAFIYDDVGFALYKEDGKLLDLVGGKMEFGESFEATMRREWKEELNIPVPDSMKPDEISQTVDSTTRLYTVFGHIDHPKLQWFPWNQVIDGAGLKKWQRWTPRLILKLYFSSNCQIPHPPFYPVRGKWIKNGLHINSKDLALVLLEYGNIHPVIVHQGPVAVLSPSRQVIV